MTSRFSSGSAASQTAETRPFRGSDASHSSLQQHHEASFRMANPVHRAVSKPLTVQQLEATLMQKESKLEKEPSWPSSPSNNSIWTPLTGPSLWGDGTIFTKVKVLI